MVVRAVLTFQPMFSKKCRMRLMLVVLPAHGPPVNTTRCMRCMRPMGDKQCRLASTPPPWCASSSSTSSLTSSRPALLELDVALSWLPLPMLALSLLSAMSLALCGRCDNTRSLSSGMVPRGESIVLLVVLGMLILLLLLLLPLSLVLLTFLLLLASGLSANGTVVLIITLMISLSLPRGVCVIPLRIGSNGGHGDDDDDVDGGRL